MTDPRGTYCKHCGYGPSCSGECLSKTWRKTDTPITITAIQTSQEVEAMCHWKDCPNGSECVHTQDPRIAALENLEAKHDALVSKAEARRERLALSTVAPVVEDDLTWLSHQGDFSAHTVPSIPHDYELELHDVGTEGTVFTGETLLECIAKARRNLQGK